MEIEIRRFSSSDIDDVYAIQQAAFRPVYEKYHDEELSPYLESRETVLRKYMRDGTYGYLFSKAGVSVGAVRILVDDEQNSAKVSGLCVSPQYQGQGIAQRALIYIEKLHNSIARWYLDTILEEAGSCHLYERLGYSRTGKTERINDKMTLVFYEKNLNNSGSEASQLIEI